MTAKLHPMDGRPVPRSWPVRTGGQTGRVGSFGLTRVGADGGAVLHKGVDFLGVPGQPIYAAHDGVITRTGWQSPRRQGQGGYGQRIYLRYGDSLETVYAHLALCVYDQDDRVSRGACIGLLGRTGNVAHDCPTHLHFEVRRHGEPLDPMEWLGEVATTRRGSD